MAQRTFVEGNTLRFHQKKKWCCTNRSQLPKVCKSIDDWDSLEGETVSHTMVFPWSTIRPTAWISTREIGGDDQKHANGWEGRRSSPTIQTKKTTKTSANNHGTSALLNFNGSNGTALLSFLAP